MTSTEARYEFGLYIMNTNLFFPCQLDGVRVRPPVRPHEGIRIYQRTTRIYLETDFGLYLSFDGNQNAGK